MQATSQTSNGLIIIGAGHAAVRAALAMRENGYEGSITMVADEGVEQPYERPPLSKWSADTTTLLKPLVPDDALLNANIHFQTSTVTDVDTTQRTITLDNNSSLAYSKLLIATGASARRLPESVTGQNPVHYLRNIADAQAIRHVAEKAHSILIIGGGFIGLELAASLRSMDIKVKVIETENRLLTRAVSGPIATIIQQLHEDNGVEFLLDTHIKQIVDPGIVVLDDASAITSDMIIAGVGSVANTTLAEKAGLESSHGICVDTFLHTSHPDIFAAGDCCLFPLYGPHGAMTRLESWQAAGDQGALAGKNMVTATPDSYLNTPWFWSEQYNHVLQATGVKEAHMEEIHRTYAHTHAVSFGIRADGSLGYACAIAPGLKVAKDVRFAMKLIESGKRVCKQALEDTSVSLKSLL